MKRFTMDVLLELEDLAQRMPFDLSPDGRLLAVGCCGRRSQNWEAGPEEEFSTRGVPVDAAGTRVAIVDTETGAASYPFRDVRTSWVPSWSPDGERLVACVEPEEGQACLAVWERRGDRVRLFRDVHVRTFLNFEVPAWTPDSTRVVVKTVPAVQEGVGQQPPRGLSVTVRAHVPGAADDEEEPQSRGATLPPTDHGGLALVDVSTGDVVRLIDNWALRCWRMSPTGDQLAVARCVEDFEWRHHALHVIRLDEAGPGPVLARMRQQYGTAFSWAPDGERIAYRSTVRDASRGIWVVRATGEQEPVLVTPGVEGAAFHGDSDAGSTPRWRADGQSLLCRDRDAIWDMAADGSGARRIGVGDDALRFVEWLQPPEEHLLRTDEDGCLPVVLLDRASGRTLLGSVDLRSETTSVRHRLDGVVRDPQLSCEVAADGCSCYFVCESGSHPQSLWRASHAQAERLWAPRSVQDDIGLGEAQRVEWQVVDGRTVRGALVLPPDHGAAPPPLILNIYPGDGWSELVDAFGFGERGVQNPHLLAAHGYAVLYPDMPLEDGEPMAQWPGLVLPAVDHLASEGRIDGGRVGVMGHSYGGTGVLGLIVQTERFAAAVCLDGGVNLTSEYAAMGWEWAEKDQGGMPGSLWEHPDAYIRNSPLFRLDRATTPLLIVSGGAVDWARQQALETWHAMRRLGKRAEWRCYEHEGHAYEDWSEANQRDLCDAILRWFAEHL